ncbi:hypothetical protein BJY04DRAFT_178239 [Aspergillus karnatakaensis]|uniref:uncharacterized protein n=1 Tax=Aspergillus karnatakaensis TaxID=1810916 RepID=UPI003CCDC880
MVFCPASYFTNSQCQRRTGPAHLNPAHINPQRRIASEQRPPHQITSDLIPHDFTISYK